MVEEKQAFSDAVAHCRRALVSSSRALLVTEGMDFDDDMECLQKFKSLIVDMEIVPEKYAALIERCESYPTSPDSDETQLWFDETAGLVAACRKVYDKLNTDKSLRIRVDGDDIKKPAAPVGDGNATAVKLDLLGVKCPFNYVKTKIKLETMASGSLLEVLLDDGEPSENVPRSIQNDGHKLVSLEKDNGHYTMLVKKA